VSLLGDLYDANVANRRFLHSRLAPGSRAIEEYRRLVADAIYPDPFSKRRVSLRDAAAAIVEAAQVQKADLIVMSTHGRSGLGRLILGSVAESVLRGTRTPILVIRADSAPVEPQVGAKPAKETARV